MLLKQLPTSSSSSGSRADSDGQETSSQAHIENPSPPTPTSTPQNPTLPQTQAPLRIPEHIPFVPLVPYGGDDFEEEEEEQAAAAPAEGTSSVPPLHTESAAVFSTPTPSNGEDSSSPTLLEPTQSIEVINVEDESTKDLPPPPSEILQQREAGWNFILHAEDESIPEEEEELLHRRSRRVEVGRLIEGVEANMASMQRAAEEKEERLRVGRQLNEPDEPESLGAAGAINQEAEEEGRAVKDSRQKAERKRKGKETAAPPPKKMRPASRGIVITDADQPAPPQEGIEGSNTEERELQWARTSRRHQGRPATPPAAEHAKQTVVLTADLLRQMLVFENPKWNDEVQHRVTTTKLMKAGKRLHQPSLEKIRVEEKFTQYITGIGFEWLLESEDTFVPADLAKEFFTSFRFSGSTNLEARSVSFRVFRRKQKMSLNEFSVRMGLHTDAQVARGEWFGRDIGLPQRRPDFDQQAVWQSLCNGHAPEFKTSESRADHIADPALRLAQAFLACNLLGQANTLSILTLAELYFMWCMKEQRRVHLGYWIAHSISQIASRPARHLNVCHLLGAYLRRNWILEFQEGVELPDRCPKPELFNIDFFVRIQVLERLRDGRLRFSSKTRKERQPEQQGVGRDEQEEAGRERRRRITDQPASPDRQPRQRLELANAAEPAEDARAVNEWRLRMEQMLTQLVANSDSQLVAQSRVLQAIRQLTLAMQAPFPSTSSPPPRHPTISKPPSASPSQPRKH